MDENPYSPPQTTEDTEPKRKSDDVVDTRTIVIAFTWIVVLATSAYTLHSVSSKLGTLMSVCCTLIYGAFSLFAMSRILKLYTKI